MTALVIALTTILADGSVLVKSGDRLVMEYLYAGKEHTATKPYVRKLLSPAGVNPLRDNVIDHIHHHALMFAVAVDGVDFWIEHKNAGRQATKDVKAVKRAEGQIQGLQSTVEWRSADGKLIACETRTVEVMRGPEVTLLWWTTTLSPAPGKDSIKLTGSHYFGLGLRFVQSMDKADRFFFADAEPKSTLVRGVEKVTPSAWAAFGGAADGREVTVAMFDHPANIRQACWFTMYAPFAYLSATLNLYREPLTVQADKPLTLRYGVAVWDGKAPRERVEKTARGWIEMSTKP